MYTYVPYFIKWKCTISQLAVFSFLTQASIMSHLRQRFVAGLVSLSLVYKTSLLYKYKTCHWALLYPLYSYLSRKDALLLALCKHTSLSVRHQSLVKFHTWGKQLYVFFFLSYININIHSGSEEVKVRGASQEPPGPWTQEFQRNAWECTVQ